jgi:hypothetical protein
MGDCDLDKWLLWKAGLERQHGLISCGDFERCGEGEGDGVGAARARMDGFETLAKPGPLFCRKDHGSAGASPYRVCPRFMGALRRSRAHGVLFCSVGQERLEIYLELYPRGLVDVEHVA